MEQPSFFSILTADVRYSKEITDFQKILYSEITALSNKWGYCTALNQYFADLYDKDVATISRSISSLAKHTFLRVEFEMGDGTKRRLYPIVNQGGVDKNVNGGTQKSQGGVDKNVNHNNTSTNSKENKIYKEEPLKVQTQPTPPLPPAELKVLEALLTAERFFEKYPAQQQMMCERAKRSDALHPKVFRDTLEAWIRYNIDNPAIICHIETSITKSFQAWLTRNLEANNRPKNGFARPGGQDTAPTAYKAPVNQKLQF